MFRFQSSIINKLYFLYMVYTTIELIEHVWQTNTMIYQDVFSCVPNDLIHSRYLVASIPFQHYFWWVATYSCIFWNTMTMQDPVSAKHCLLEGENWPHDNWSRCCPREARNLPGWRSQRYRPYGQIAVGQGPSCIFPFGFHVPRGLETIFQWKRVLHISASFPLGYFSRKKLLSHALVVHNTCASL
jgi:hypothetical protein